MITDGLVLYVPLYSTDLQGSPIISKDSYSHSGVVTGTIWTPQGRTFANTKNIDLRVGGNPPASLNFAHGASWTLEGWFNHSLTAASSFNFFTGKTDYTGILFRHSSVDAYEFRDEDNTYYIFLADASAYNGIWTHLLWICNGTTITLHINCGAGVAITPNTGLEISLIGSSDSAGNSYNYEGICGELRCYNRTLSLEEGIGNRLETLKTYVACWDFFTWA